MNSGHDYVNEINHELDLEFFKDLANQMMTDEWLSSPDHIGLVTSDLNPVQVNDHSYLKGVRDKFPKLFDHLKLFKCGNGPWPIHIDRLRDTALNIPVINCNETKLTNFYSDDGVVAEEVTCYFGKEYRTWKSQKYSIYITNASLSYSHSLTNKPVIINTSVPHNIVNHNDEPRLIWSWGYDDTYNNARGVFT